MWEYRAAPLWAVDGDTVRLLVDLGFYARHEIDVRLAGVSAPELSAEGGPETLEFVAQWLASSPPERRWPLLVRTQITATPEPTERRSFTRYVAQIFRLPDAECLNDRVNAFLARGPAQNGPPEAP